MRLGDLQTPDHDDQRADREQEAGDPQDFDGFGAELGMGANMA